MSVIFLTDQKAYQLHTLFLHVLSCPYSYFVIACPGLFAPFLDKLVPFYIIYPCVVHKVHYISVIVEVEVLRGFIDDIVNLWNYNDKMCLAENGAKLVPHKKHAVNELSIN